MANPQINQNELVSAVEDKKFIPFIGLGASTRRKDNLKECYRILTRIRKLKEKGTEEENRYLDSLAKAQDITAVPEQAAIGDTIKAEEEKLSEKLPQVGNLTMHLTKLGSALIGLFGDLMKQNRNCIGNIYNYQVPLPLHNEEYAKEIRGLHDILKGVLSAARSLVENIRDIQKYSGTDMMAESIYRELIILAYRLCEDQILGDQSEYSILKIHEDRIGSLHGTLSMHQQETIRLDELAWIEDLVWYTLRYDIPMYLDSNELTFRLSLDPRIEELRRSELAQVAEHQRMNKKLPPYDQMIKHLAENLYFCAKNNPHIPKFHRAMAATLWYEFEEYQKRGTELLSSDYMETDMQDAINYSMLPLVITTNYDSLIEGAFHWLHKSYEVVYPVWRFQQFADNPSQSPDWYNRTYTYTGLYGDGYEASEPKDCSKTLRKDLKFKGPIIVKLHGSPLEPLPKTEKFRVIQHAITLTESDYLSTIVQASQSPAVYPTWIEEFLQEKNNSAWWLMGYNDDDWFAHLRIYKYLSYLEIPSRNAISLAETFDPVRSAFLDTQKVRKVQLDLDLVADTLRLRVKRIGEILEEAEREERL